MTKRITKRISITQPPWGAMRDGVEPADFLYSTSPRILTIATHGQGSLLRTFFPEPEALPEVTLAPERLIELTKRTMAVRIAGLDNLQVGGCRNKISELEKLQAPDTTHMEETEPLRAMSLREATNIEFLKDYNTYCVEKDEQDDQEGAS